MIFTYFFGLGGWSVDLMHCEWLKMCWSCSVFQWWLVYMDGLVLCGGGVGEGGVDGGWEVSFPLVDSVPTECVGAQTLGQLGAAAALVISWYQESRVMVSFILSYQMVNCQQFY